MSLEKSTMNVKANPYLEIEQNFMQQTYECALFSTNHSPM